MGAKGGEDGPGQLSNEVYLKLPMGFYQEHPELSPAFPTMIRLSVCSFWLYSGGCFSFYGLL